MFEFCEGLSCGMRPRDLFTVENSPVNLRTCKLNPLFDSYMFLTSQMVIVAAAQCCLCLKSSRTVFKVSFEDSPINCMLPFPPALYLKKYLQSVL